jgi:hypothetical protein
MNAGGGVSWLRTLAERTLHPLTVERVIAPAFDDLEHECSTTTSPRARLSAHAAILKTVVVCMAGDAVRDPDRHSLSLLIRFFAALVIIAVVMTLPMARWHVSFAEAFGLTAALSAYFYLTASALALALPCALFFALACHRFGANEAAARLLPAALAGVLVSTAAMIAMMAAISPMANEAYREVVYSHLSASGRQVTMRPGMTEMTLPALNEFIRHAPSRRAAELARTHRHSRFALVAAVFVLGALGFSLAGRWRSRVATIAAGIGLLAVYTLCFAVVWSRTGQGQVFSMWMTNAAFLVVALALIRARGGFAAGHGDNLPAVR